MCWETVNRVRTLTGLTLAQRMVLTELAARMNHQTGRCFGRRKEIAERCSISVRCLRDQIKALGEMGLLRDRVTRHGDGDKITEFELFPEPVEGCLDFDQSTPEAATDAASKRQQMPDGSGNSRHPKRQMTASEAARDAASYKDEPEINRKTTGNVVAREGSVSIENDVSDGAAADPTSRLPVPIPGKWVAEAIDRQPKLNIKAIASRFEADLCNAPQPAEGWRQRWLSHVDHIATTQAERFALTPRPRRPVVLPGEARPGSAGSRDSPPVEPDLNGQTYGYGPFKPARRKTAAPAPLTTSEET